MINNVTMQLKIYINEKIWKTVTLETETYEPNDYWPVIAAEKEQGLLADFNLDSGMKVEFRRVN
jgi:hypothetical protein